MDPMPGFDIRLVFTLPPRDSTLQKMRTSLNKFSLHYNLGYFFTKSLYYLTKKLLDCLKFYCVFLIKNVYFNHLVDKTIDL